MGFYLNFVGVGNFPCITKREIKTMPKTKGYVLYEGPSAINGESIAAILTLESTNKKTGNMAQLWILAKDIPPHIAQKTGDDDAVCGDCPIKKECYVITFQGPLSVWNAYKRGTYENIADTFQPGKFIDTSLMFLMDLIIRFGAYGDPAALPKWLIKTISKNCKDFTGYTHQWNKRKFNYLKNYFMASVETKKFAEKALKKGFRYFRIKPPSAINFKKEIDCPSNIGIQCIDCKLCNGSKQAKNITIEAHGARARGIAYV
mgnify:FL=1